MQTHPEKLGGRGTEKKTAQHKHPNTKDEGEKQWKDIHK